MSRDMPEMPEIIFMKNAIRDFEKVIKAEQSRIEKANYMFIEEEKPKDLARVSGMISAKIFFEKYYKKHLHQQEEEQNNG